MGAVLFTLGFPVELEAGFAGSSDADGRASSPPGAPNGGTSVEGGEVSACAEGAGGWARVDVSLPGRASAEVDAGAGTVGLSVRGDGIFAASGAGGPVRRGDGASLIGVTCAALGATGNGNGTAGAFGSGS